MVGHVKKYALHTPVEYATDKCDIDIELAHEVE